MALSQQIETADAAQLHPHARADEGRPWNSNQCVVVLCIQPAPPNRENTVPMRGAVQ